MRSGWSRTLARPTRSAPAATLPAHPRIATVRETSWITATTDFRSRALEDRDTVVEVLQQVALMDGSEILRLGEDSRLRLEDVLARVKARELARGRPFSRREVNTRLRDGEHRDLMHQQW